MRLIALLVLIGVAAAAIPPRRALEADAIGITVAHKTFNKFGLETEVQGQKLFMAVRLHNTAANNTFTPRTQFEAEQFCQHIGYEWTMEHDWHLAKIHNIAEDAAINAALGAQPDYQNLAMWTAGTVSGPISGGLQFSWNQLVPYTPWPVAGYPHTSFPGGAPTSAGGVYFVTGAGGGVGTMYTMPANQKLMQAGGVSGVLCNRCIIQDAPNYNIYDNCEVVPQAIE